MPPKVAAVTMTYNEPAYLPVWARHYSRQVGADHCYVVDHGSTEDLILPRGMNAIRIPRSPHDDPKRALFISSLVEGLLEYYDWVIHTDVDELALADPHDYPNLPAFCRGLELDTVTAIGLDVQHVPAHEPPLTNHASLGEQRQWVRFSSALCKPLLTRRPLVWSPGFHSADTPMVFAGLYLFHLHWADYRIGLSRLEKTRTMPWADPAFGAHQRMTNAQWTATFDSMAAFPQGAPVSFSQNDAPLATWIERTRQSSVYRAEAPYTLDLTINAPELWPIPPRFRARL